MRNAKRKDLKTLNRVQSAMIKSSTQNKAKNLNKKCASPH